MKIIFFIHKLFLHQKPETEGHLLQSAAPRTEDALLRYTIYMWLTIFLFVILLVVLLGVWVGVSALIGVVRTRVPLVHSSSAHAAEVFRSLHFSHSTVFYELGSGNGRIVFLAERMGAGRIVGFELVTWAHALACLRTW